MKLVGLERSGWKIRAPVFVWAAQVMCGVLLDHVVSRRAQQRGGEPRRVSLDRTMLITEQPLDERLALHDAPTDPEAVHQRPGRIVEGRYSEGLSVEETAATLGISPATVKWDRTRARAWRDRELSE